MQQKQWTPFDKPECKLLGEDGNVYNIISKVASSLKRAGFHKESSEFKQKALASHSYDDVLMLAAAYVDIV